MRQFLQAVVSIDAAAVRRRWMDRSIVTTVPIGAMVAADKPCCVRCDSDMIDRVQIEL